MDATFCRRFFPEAATVLRGARIDKVFFPAPGVFTLSLSYAPGGGRSKPPKHLLGRFGAGRFLLFFSKDKPENPAQAPARAMWLRKRLKGRRILDATWDWPSRLLALALSPGEAAHLLIDPKNGPVLRDDLPEGFGREAVWPSLERVLTDEAVWREFPQISPTLRRRLRAMAPETARAALERLADGEPGPVFLRLEKAEPRELTAFPPVADENDPGEIQTFDDPLEAAAAFGSPPLFAAVREPERREEAAADRGTRRKKARLLDRLADDAKRMEGLAALKELGQALAANLYALDPRLKTSRLELTHPDGRELVVPLDPCLTVGENMGRFFAKAAKGERGLVRIEALRREAASERPLSKTRKTGRNTAAAPESLIPRRYQGEPVHVYRTSDGFTALRGKNAKANDRLLTRLAGPHDLWFHVADGPGAHVILKRDHPGQEPPLPSMEEAAALAALASCRAEEASALVLWAKVGDVRKVKGAAAGQVAVDRAGGTIMVRLDREIETRLRVT